MLIRLFDVQNGKVIPTEHCYALKFLQDIIEFYPEEHMKILGYLFYMSCPNPDLNPYFNVPEDDKEEIVLGDLGAEFSTEDDLILEALEKTKKLYETPTYRSYLGMKKMLDRLAYYMETTEISHGRDGNITALVNAAKNFDAIRTSFKGVYKDLQDEQKSSVRGGKNLAYDQ
jgi:hypothetical protein